MQDKVLVVALDGMDKELVEKYEMDFFTENEEYGPVDTTVTRYTKTNEIFASFVTGRAPEKHGVYALNKWDRDTINRFEHWSGQYKFFRKWKGIRGLFYSLLGLNSNGGIVKKTYRPTQYSTVSTSPSRFYPELQS